MRSKIAIILSVILLSVTMGYSQVRVESTDPDISVKLSRCVYNSGTVSADIVLTNFISERSFTFVGTGERNCKTTAYDDEGNQYTRNITMGRIGEAQKSWFNFTLPQDIPIKVRVQLKGVDANASKLALLQIGLEKQNSMGVQIDPIKIYNLEWIK